MAELLHVFTPDFERLGLLDTYISLVWEEEYQGRGALMIVCSDIPENIRLLQEGNMLWQRGKQTAMIIKYVKKESADSLITVHGYTALNYLNQRIIYPTLTIYNVETGMRNAVSQHLRAFPRIAVAASKGFPEIFDTQFTGDEVLDALKVLGVESEIGYQMEFDYDNALHVFSPYKGRDLTIGDDLMLFKEEFGSLQGMTIVDDNTIFKNVAYVAGAGEGAARKVIIVGTATGRNRYEMFVDAKDLQPDEEKGETAESPAYIQLLTARGIEKLNQQIRVQTFIAAVDYSGFRTLFDLGDIVTCSSTKYGVTLNTRITGFKEVTERNMTTLSLTFGNPEIIMVGNTRLR